MDILTLKITNFLTIGDAPKINLKNGGLVLIQGVNEDDPSAISNGAGKSSIVDALCWALYGETARDESGDAIVNDKIGKNCSVSVVVRDGDSNYCITRYRKHSKHKNEVHIRCWTEGDPSTVIDMSKGTSGLTQPEIDKIMGCPLEVFKAAIYAGQENAPDLPKKTDKELKMLIEEAAGVSKLEAAYKVALKRQATAQTQLNAVLAVTARIEGDIIRAKNDLDAAHENHAAFEAGRPARAASHNELAERERVSMIADVTAIKSYKEAELKGRYEALQADLSSHAAKLKKKDAIAKSLADAQRTHNFKKDEVTRAIAAVKSRKAQYDNAEVEMAKPCPECNKPHTADELESFKEHLMTKLKEQAKSLTELQGLEAAAAPAVAEWETTLAEFVATIPDVSAASIESADLNSKLTEIVRLKGKIETRKKEYDRQKELSTGVMTERNPHESALEVLQKRLDESRVSHAKALTDIPDLERDLDIANSVVKVFSPAGVRAHILDTVTPFLNDRTADYLSGLSDGNISAVWTTLATTAKGELREKFNIEVQNDKGGKTFKSISGGEKRKVRLSTMLGLQDLVASRATKPINLWIGDEIDEALDAAGLERLMGILEKKARERGTVLVISHNSLTDWCDQALVITKGADGISTIAGALVA